MNSAAKNPYTTDDLIKHLERFWEQAEGIEYGHEHEVMRCAADRLRKLKEERAKLDQRIRNQRAACRVNWEIVELRRKGMRGPEARRFIKYLIDRNRELQKRLDLHVSGHKRSVR